VPPQVIDKGIPTAGLLAHVMVAKFADHHHRYRYFIDLMRNLSWLSITSFCVPTT
jgi:hypothetical protein